MWMVLIMLVLFGISIFFNIVVFVGFMLVLVLWWIGLILRGRECGFLFFCLCRMLLIVVMLVFVKGVMICLCGIMFISMVFLMRFVIIIRLRIRSVISLINVGYVMNLKSVMLFGIIFFGGWEIMVFFLGGRR